MPLHLLVISAIGAKDSSNEIKPQHIFNAPGTYPVKLVAYNGPLTDTAMINVIINPVNFTYTFTGNGNWDQAANWDNNLVPPSTLPATNSIVIDHINGGTCILNNIQRILNGAGITVLTGKNLLIPGGLIIQ